MFLVPPIHGVSSLRYAVPRDPHLSNIQDRETPLSLQREAPLPPPPNWGPLSSGRKGLNCLMPSIAFVLERHTRPLPLYEASASINLAG